MLFCLGNLNLCDVFILDKQPFEHWTTSFCIINLSNQTLLGEKIVYFLFWMMVLKLKIKSFVNMIPVYNSIGIYFFLNKEKAHLIWNDNVWKADIWYMVTLRAARLCAHIKYIIRWIIARFVTATCAFGWLAHADRREWPFRRHYSINLRRIIYNFDISAFKRCYDQHFDTVFKIYS